MNPLRDEIVGVDSRFLVLDGTDAPYINFDNAASTPCLKRVLDKVGEFLSVYSSIHRGTGFKSRLSTRMYEKARCLAGEFVGYDPVAHAVIFGKNTTEAINKLSHRLPIPNQSVIIVSQMEHHSNDLPWRDKSRVLFAPVNRVDGTVNLERLACMIDEHRCRLFLVALTGASNVTGNINPLAAIARMVHEAGGYLLVDGAQLVPHRRVRMGKPGEPDSIDFLAYSAHKMYAPFGIGVLVARQDLLKAGAPEYRGGGTVKAVTEDRIIWADEPEVDEAGSPNVVGAIALAESIRFFQEKGFEAIEERENRMGRMLLEELSSIPEIEIYGRGKPYVPTDRLAVVPFNIRNMPHGLVAAMLAYEFGIGVRNGCFCAHPYVKILLDVVGEREDRFLEAMAGNDRREIPGAVRVSFGFYNDEWELERFLVAVRRIIGKDGHGRYDLNPGTGEYYPRGYRGDYDRYFAL